MSRRNETQGCCWCGTGTGLCGDHARRVRENATHEARPPAQRDPAVKPWR